MTLNGRPLSLEVVPENVIFPPSAGNLPTMKIGMVYHAPFSRGMACPRVLEYRDRNLAERAGWKEVVATAGASAVLVMSNAAGASDNQELTN